MADFATAFTRMAERIAAIEEGDFNGALVVVGPDGTVIELLMQGTRDEGLFWGTGKIKVEAALAQFEQRHLDQNFGGFRR